MGHMQLDVQFWNTCQDAYFDVMVFHTNAPSNHVGSLSTAYMKHEDEKKEHMASVYLILNIAEHLLHFFSQPQVVWEEKHKPSTNAWPTCCL